MADRIQVVERALNQVASAGQARAALAAASAELDRGLALVPMLSAWSTPDPGQGYETLTPFRTALDAETRAIASQADTSPVDESSWPRARREIERVYVEVAGVEGAAGAVAAIDVGQIITDAVANAPKVFGQAVGSILQTAGSAAGGLAGGFLGGLGLWGVLVLIVIAVLVLRRRLI